MGVEECSGVGEAGCRVEVGVVVGLLVGVGLGKPSDRRVRACSRGAANGPNRHNQPRISETRITRTVPRRAGVIVFARPWRACAVEASIPGRNSVRISSSYGWWRGG